VVRWGRKSLGEWLRVLANKLANKTTQAARKRPASA
jgi:hypothetical protein